MSSDEQVRQAIMKELQEARSCYDNPPPNEACTCDWVILPILHAAGYAKMDIISQGGNINGGYPDYTILPDSQYTWYLEAKDWKKHLDNTQDATQALNYANSQGRRWVVLSNGREWLLFDNHIQGVQASGRLVARASLSDDGFMDLILALSKASVTSGALEHYAQKSRLRTLLTKQITTKDSPIIKTISSTLKSKFGFSGVQPADVAAFFADLLISPPSGAENSKKKPVPKPEEPSTGNTFDLGQLLSLGNAVWNNQPQSLKLPNGASVAVISWRDVAEEVVKWIAHEKGLPELPFRGTEKGKRWFLNTESVHEDGKKMVSRKLVLNGKDVHMDVHLSSSSITTRLYALCIAVGVSVQSFVVGLA